MAGAWTVRPAHPSHIARLANRMRALDVAECAAVGHTPKQALRISLRSSTFALTVLRDGRPVAMLGVCPASVIRGLGAPWLLGTDEVKAGARVFLTVGPRVVKAMHREWPRLANYVGAENRDAIRVLRMLGFAVETEEVLIGGMPMRRFSRGE